MCVSVFLFVQVSSGDGWAGVREMDECKMIP